MKSKRISITLKPEWGTDFTNLKKEKFFNQSTATMIRFLIAEGLKHYQSKTRERL